MISTLNILTELLNIISYHNIISIIRLLRKLALKHPTLEDNQHNENHNSQDLIPSVAKGSFNIIRYRSKEWRRHRNKFIGDTVSYDSKL